VFKVIETAQNRLPVSPRFAKTKKNRNEGTTYLSWEYSKHNSAAASDEL
jgi:hypothetical protein